MSIIPKNTDHQAKLSVLYMLDLISTEIEKDQIWRAFSKLDIMPYIDLIEYLDNLKQGGMIHENTVNNCVYYSITQKGRNILSEFKIDIRKSIREKLDDYCRKHKKIYIAERDLEAEITRENAGEYMAHLKMMNEHKQVFGIDILYKSREEAQAAIKSWQDNASDIYSKVFDILAENKKNRS